MLAAVPPAGGTTNPSTHMIAFTNSLADWNLLKSTETQNNDHACRIATDQPIIRQERAEAAMKSAGASVLTGITLTKLVGVSVLAIAPSLLFRVYYFRMYMATVAVGAFQVCVFAFHIGIVRANRLTNEKYVSVSAVENTRCVRVSLF